MGGQRSTKHWYAYVHKPWTQTRGVKAWGGEGQAALVGMGGHPRAASTDYADSNSHPTLLKSWGQCVTRCFCLMSAFLGQEAGPGDQADHHIHALLLSPKIRGCCLLEAWES